MDIRGPRLKKQSDVSLAFTSSMGPDGRIARHVIRINIAHMSSLVEAGVVSRRTGASCLNFLLGATATARPGAMAEDFHQRLEQEAVDSIGVETAGYLNYGKSRNDQVATAIRMELRERAAELADAVCGLQRALLGVAGTHGKALVPGYTHLQRAQPVTLAHHLFAYFDSFQRDYDRLVQLYQRANLSPMGAAALAGTSVRVDRKEVASMLGFGGVVPNAMDAVSSRDVSIEALFCTVATMVDASRLAEELILWSSREFGFVELDDSYAASSSIMPQKKNPVAAEIVRAKASSVIGDLVAVCSMLKALPYSYNLDLQEATPPVWKAFDDAVDSVLILKGSLSSLNFNSKGVRASMEDDGSTAVGLANYLVQKEGVSFREAHAIVGELTRVSLEGGTSLAAAAASSLPDASSKFGRSLTIGKRTADRVLDPWAFVSGIVTEGGANPKFVRAELRWRSSLLAKNRARLRAMVSSLNASEKKLQKTARGIAREVKSKS